MKISREKLFAEAASTGFRADMLEKVARLLGLLHAMQQHPYSNGKLVLKGGTALNLFVFDVPRLSVDIDLNYIGAVGRDQMLDQRPKLEAALQAVFAREDYTVRRVPSEHAGGKWLLRYTDASGMYGNLEVDLNYMFRVPLWPIKKSDSHRLGAWQASEIPILDLHELAAGKLAALLARGVARDIFDAVKILEHPDIEFASLRTAFVVYGAMNRKDWRTVSVDDVDVDPVELGRQLIPLLRVESEEFTLPAEEYGAGLVATCKKLLARLLPFTGNERAFLDKLLEYGEIDAALLTDDADVQTRIQNQPLLYWKTLNVREHRHLD
ncbi:MAG: nucleotidyl transferase AbiEii/AbiGii toxin family protein [Bacteroidia bacterium]|nr:nucleotidyl transferase AbiEii/AbiGii toxin family protein [Bacteroidia bacterium]